MTDVQSWTASICLPCVWFYRSLVIPHQNYHCYYSPHGWTSNTVSLKAARWDGWAESREWRIEQAVCWFQQEMVFHYFLFLWCGLIVITDNQPPFHIHHFTFIIWRKMFIRKKDLFLYFGWIFMINFLAMSVVTDSDNKHRSRKILKQEKKKKNSKKKYLFPYYYS